MRQAAARSGGGTAEKLGEPPQGLCAVAVSSTASPHAIAAVDVLLRQKSIRDNQTHHARENQQCRNGFSDHWPRRMARS